jgi:hypothetical protein
VSIPNCIFSASAAPVFFWGLFLCLILLFSIGCLNHHAVCPPIYTFRTFYQFVRKLVWTNAIGGHFTVILFNFLESGITWQSANFWGGSNLNHTFFTVLKLRVVMHAGGIFDVCYISIFVECKVTI